MFRRKLPAALLLLAGLGLSGASPAPPDGAAPSVPLGEEMNCKFDILARNSGSVDVYLDLYTSTVYRGMYGTLQLKISNARVGPGKTIPPQPATVGGRCNAGRVWIIRYRKGSKESNHRFETGSGTRVSSSTGNRVLDLGDVGRW